MAQTVRKAGEVRQKHRKCGPNLFNFLIGIFSSEISKIRSLQQNPPQIKIFAKNAEIGIIQRMYYMYVKHCFIKVEVLVRLYL